MQGLSLRGQPARNTPGILPHTVLFTHKQNLAIFVDNSPAAAHLMTGVFGQFTGPLFNQPFRKKQVFLGGVVHFEAMFVYYVGVLQVVLG